VVTKVEVAQIDIALEVEIIRVKENAMALVRQYRRFRLCLYLIWLVCVSEKKNNVLSIHLGKSSVQSINAMSQCSINEKYKL